MCCPILFGVSTLAHTLSMVVLSSKSVRCSNNGVYLAAMSVVNILILNVGLLRQWLRFSSFQIDIVKHFGPVVCKVGGMFHHTHTPHTHTHTHTNYKQQQTNKKVMQIQMYN